MVSVVPLQARLPNSGFFERLQQKWGFKLGRIADLTATPCQNNNAFIFVAAFFSAIPQALATLHTHDCSDNSWDKVKNLYLPLGPRGGGRHGRKGTPLFQGDRNLPGQGPPCGGWCQQVFRMGDLIQRIGAKLLIIDAALDLGINWMSNTLEWNGCGVPPPIQGTGSVSVPGTYSDHGRSVPCDIAGHPGNVGILFGIGGFICSAPAGNLEMNCNMIALPWDPFPFAGQCQVQFRVQNPSGAFLPLDQVQGGGPNSMGGASSYARASMNLISPVGISGDVLLTEPSGGQDHVALVSADNIVTVAGQTEGMIFADRQADPCGNLPLTGTAPRAR